MTALVVREALSQTEPELTASRRVLPARTAPRPSPAPVLSLRRWPTGPGPGSESRDTDLPCQADPGVPSGPEGGADGPLSPHPRGPRPQPGLPPARRLGPLLLPTEKLRHRRPPAFAPAGPKMPVARPARCSNPREVSFRRLKHVRRSTPPPRGVEVVATRGQCPCEAAAGCNPADASCLHQGPGEASVTTDLLCLPYFSPDPCGRLDL